MKNSVFLAENVCVNQPIVVCYCFYRHSKTHTHTQTQNETTMGWNVLKHLFIYPKSHALFEMDLFIFVLICFLLARSFFILNFK